MSDTQHLAGALVEALARLTETQRLLETALAALGSHGVAPHKRLEPPNRTTSTQILAILAGSPEPLTLIDIADEVIALRRGEETPKKGGGHRYQELCRNSLIRMINRGLVERVEPTDRKGRVRFRRANVPYWHDAHAEHARRARDEPSP